MDQSGCVEISFWESNEMLQNLFCTIVNKAD